MPPEASPLHLLLTMLPARLEAVRPDALSLFERARSTGLITGRVRVSDAMPADGLPEPIGPCAHPQGDVEIPLDFAERLWAVTYGLFVLSELHGANALIARGEPAAIAPPSNVADSALFALLSALNGPLRPWPDELPAPADVLPDHRQTHADVGWWVGRANGLFLEALTYVTLHEVAHLLQHHATQMAEVRRAVAVARAEFASEDARLETARQPGIEMEREADLAARELMLGPGVGEESELPRGLGAVAACVTGVLFAYGFGRLRQSIHPDRDVRLLQLLEALDEQRLADKADEAPDAREALWRMAAVGLFTAGHLWCAPIAFSGQADGWRRVAEQAFAHFEERKIAS